MERYAVIEKATGAEVHVYERPHHPWLFGNQWDNEELFDKVLKPWVPEESKVEKLWSLREQRNHLLLNGDWRIIRAVEQGTLDSPEIVSLKTYRQALRDLPITVDTDLDVIIAKSITSTKKVDAIRDYEISWPEVQ